MARILVTSSAGSPIALKTITMVTSPACGTLAAPMDARVAVMLKTDTVNSTRTWTYNPVAMPSQDEKFKQMIAKSVDVAYITVSCY